MAGAAFLAFPGLVLTPQLERLAGMSGLDGFECGRDVFYIGKRRL